MAALKLIILGDMPLLRISSSNGTTRCHCTRSSQAEMAALKLFSLKLITLGDRPPWRIPSSNGATRCHGPLGRGTQSRRRRGRGRGRRRR
eukprot:10552778-Karenia_brevis.AAC.1